jgi:protein ImuA
MACKRSAVRSRLAPPFDCSQKCILTQAGSDVGIAGACADPPGNGLSLAEFAVGLDSWEGLGVKEQKENNMALSLVHSAAPLHKASAFEALAAKAGLHEVFSASPADAAAATCLALGLFRPKRLLWARQELAQVEGGWLYPPGLAALGFDPGLITFMPLRDAAAVLQAGLETARSDGLSLVIMELWGPAKIYDLTASRKLALAARTSGVKLCLLRHAAEPVPSAAETRWQVKRLPSRLLAGRAPGPAGLEATLLRHRGSATPGQTWFVEWNHEQRCLAERKPFPLDAAPLFKPLAAVSGFRKLRLYKVG